MNKLIVYIYADIIRSRGPLLGVFIALCCDLVV